MPSLSRMHVRPHKMPTEIDQRGNNAVDAGNQAAWDAAQQARRDEPVGLLHLCMMTAKPDAVDCITEGVASGLHGWIAFEETGKSRESWGFWPDPSSGQSVLRALADGVPGYVQNPDPKDKGPTNATQTFAINEEQKEDLQDFIDTNQNWTYQFGVRNCVHWAQEAVEAAGQRPGAFRTPVGFKYGLQCPSRSITAIGEENTANGLPAAGLQQMPQARSLSPWKHLSEYEQAAWTALGYNEPKWDGGGQVATDSLTWSELSDAERRAAVALGYTMISWDAE